MNNTKRIAKIILWIARIWGFVSLVFLLVMVGPHLVGIFTGGANTSGGFRSTSELISFLFFPVSTMIGLGIAWKWEGIGGLITLGGIIGFHFVRPDLIFDLWIDGLAAPGLLFLLYWIISKSMSRSS